MEIGGFLGEIIPSPLSRNTAVTFCVVVSLVSVTACVYTQRIWEFSGAPSRKAQGHLKKDADLLTYLKIPSDTGHISIDKEGIPESSHHKETVRGDGR